MKIIDGNKACSKIAYLFSEVCAIYPITPSSPMAENIDELTNTSLRNLYNAKPEVIEMESEAGAAGAMHGALLTGSLASTFTASQGLLLMIPNMYKMAGEMLPGVMHCASRSLATHALSIFGDHQDIYAARSTGWCILASTNVDDAQNLAAVAHLSAIKGSLPFIHFFNGFRTSHELNTVKELNEKDLLALIDYNALNEFKNRSLNLNCGYQYGMSQTEDIYFQCTEARNPVYNNMPDIVNSYMEKINELTGKDYKPFNYYGASDAENIIVAMGSVCDTVKLVIDSELKNNKKIGLIEVHLYRPFSPKYLLDVLPSTVRNIAVLDMTKEAGSNGEPLYLDVLSVLKNKDINIVGGRYGLSSKDTNPAQIKAVYDMLESKPVNNFTIGIEDDLTNLSLPVSSYNINLNAQEFKIFGFGSDGMVSASKDILTLVNENLGKYVQGYFEYDSKKSGGVTISHLRISNEKINAPYYISSPSLVVVTKDEYFNKYDMLSGVKENAYLLINTIRNEKELNEFLPSKVKRLINEKNLNVNIINADKIAYENNIKGKISKIMEMIILKLLDIPNAEGILNNSIVKAFSSKGDAIVESNINAVKMALNSLVKVNISLDIENEDTKDLSIYEKIDLREGNSLTVKDTIPLRSGAFKWGLTQNEKRNVSVLTPEWNNEKCIECGMCSMVCPHAAIRNHIIEDKSIGKPVIGNSDYNFLVGVSPKDCTGCGLCVNTCPTKSLALKENAPDTSMYFDKENPKLFDKFTIKGSQLEKPLFEFSGACAGCGETPYIKLLTQLYGKEIVIANATGCSSIFGGSVPSTPYLLPWANSLFEDNAEFAFGMHKSYKQKQDQAISVIKDSLNAVDDETKKLFNEYLDNLDNNKITTDVAMKLDDNKIPKELVNLKAYMPKRTVWALGGDGWAYDIGYNGIDHVLHSNENIKILVLDTEVYSNTGGQASKATKLGAVAQFASFGKRTGKKDLFKIATTTDNVYVASVSLGSNMMHTIKAFKEAQEHNGPAIIIAYCPCISHGIKNGMGCSINEEKLAVECGYTLLMRYYDNNLYLDSKEPNFDKYEDFLDNEVRFRRLKLKDENLAKELLDNQIKNAKKRYEYYKSIANKN